MICSAPARLRAALLLLVALAGLVSCKEQQPEKMASAAPPSREGELFRVGSIVVTEDDLAERLQEKFAGRNDEESRQAAIDELVRRAQFVQAALDAGLADDVVVRDEVSRILEGRLRSAQLNPILKEQLRIPEERLREIYQANITSYQVAEQRRVAVLWMDAGVDPERAKRAVSKMREAREFIVQNPELMNHPAKGFSVLGADYSEHSASRFKGGVVGWLEAKGGLDPWSNAVAEVAFALEKKGEVSEVVTRKEGVFLVRIVDVKPAVTRSFESVVGELENAERARLRMEAEAKFEERIRKEFPVEWPRGGA